MCCRLATKEISPRIGPTEEGVMTLPLLEHPCVTILSPYKWMFAKGAFRGAKIRSFMSNALSSKSFIVTYLLGLEEDTMCVWVEREKGEL